MKKYFVVAGLIILVAGGGLTARFYSFGGGKSQAAMAALSSDSVFSGVPDSASSSAPSSDTSDVPPPLSQSTPTTQQATEGMLAYKNAAFHFGLLFPDNLQATEYKEQDGAVTVSFQDTKTDKGFEVYVTPYTDKQITPQRFKLDEPSGVMQTPTDIVVDGKRATMFFGNNSIMGDTREVWFIHGGFLYEVTTYKDFDSWLAGIMQTWKFI